MNGKKVKALRKLHGMDKGQKVGKHFKEVASAQARTNAAQQPKTVKLRVHKSKEPIKATWPHSHDQRMQSRPIIILRPLRHIHERHPDLKDAQGNFAGHAPFYAEALDAAKAGDGGRVQRMAQTA